VYGFVLVFYSNFFPSDALFMRYSTCKYTVTLKPRLGVTQGHWNRHQSIYHLWLPVNVLWQPWACRILFLRLMAISVQNHKFYPPRVFRPPLKGFPLE